MAKPSLFHFCRLRLRMAFMAVAAALLLVSGPAALAETPMMPAAAQTHMAPEHAPAPARQTGEHCGCPAGSCCALCGGALLASHPPGMIYALATSLSYMDKSPAMRAGRGIAPPAPPPRARI